MAPSKLNPTSQPLAPSTAALDAPGSSFSTGKSPTALFEQNKPAAGSPITKTGSRRSSSSHTSTAMAPANMSPNSAASGGWFGGWGKSRPAASRPTTHTRSKSWFGGGKSTTSGERGSHTAKSGLGAKDLGDSATTKTTTTTTTPYGPTLDKSMANTASGSVSGSDNDINGDLGSSPEDSGLGATNTGSSATNDTTPIENATGSTTDQAVQKKEETVQVQNQATTSRALPRKLSLEEPQPENHESGRKDLEAEISSLKEQLRTSFEAKVSSERERDQAREECSASQEIVKQLEKEVSALHATNHELRVERTSLKESREGLQREVSSLYTTIDELKAYNTSLEESREALQKEVSSTHSTIDKLKADNTSLKEGKELEISSLYTTICELKAENISLRESREALENVLATEKTRGQQLLEDTRQALQKELDTANSLITGLETKGTTLQDSLQTAQDALAGEKLRSRELNIRLEERRTSETKLESYLRSELEKSQTLALQQIKDLEKLREEHLRLQLATATLEKPTKKHKITKNESQKLSEQNSELMRQLQQARAQSKQLALDLAAIEEKNHEVEAAKSKFSLRDIVRRPKNDTSRPLTSYGRTKTEPSRPLTSRADRRSMFL